MKIPYMNSLHEKLSDNYGSLRLYMGTIIPSYLHYNSISDKVISNDYAPAKALGAAAFLFLVFSAWAIYRHLKKEVKRYEKHGKD